MKKILLIFLTTLGMFSSSFGQSVDDEYYAKINALDLYYIPDNIRRNIVLGRGYDLTDPWYPVIADESPFLTQPSGTLKTTLDKAFQPLSIPIGVGPGTGTQEYKMRYEEHIDERTVAQFYHAELKARGIVWGVESSVDYVKNQYNISQGVRFVLENKTDLPNDVDIKTKWTNKPITETSTLQDVAKWKLFKQKYGSHYVSSFSYGYRIEIIAFANSSSQDSKLKLNAAFNAWMVEGKFSAEISEKIKQSNATIDCAIFCKEIKDTRSGSSLPFIIRGIPDLMKFLDDLKAGYIVITPAPTTISFKSYFASICGTYPNTCKLFETVTIPADTNAIPRGTILSWTPLPQNIRTIGGQTVIIPPTGWVICDKKNNQLNPRVPDLSDKFLMGTSEYSQVGVEGGSKEHNHSAGLPRPEHGGFDDGWRVSQRGAPAATGLDHYHKISTSGHLPPYRKIVYIMKL